jgi:hypothetical protein
VSALFLLSGRGEVSAAYVQVYLSCPSVSAAAAVLLLVCSVCVKKKLGNSYGDSVCAAHVYTDTDLLSTATAAAAGVGKNCYCACLVLLSALCAVLLRSGTDCVVALEVSQW